MLQLKKKKTTYKCPKPFSTFTIFLQMHSLMNCKQKKKSF